MQWISCRRISSAVLGGFHRYQRSLPRTEFSGRHAPPKKPLRLQNCRSPIESERSLGCFPVPSPRPDRHVPQQGKEIANQPHTREFIVGDVQGCPTGCIVPPLSSSLFRVLFSASLYKIDSNPDCVFKILQIFALSKQPVQSFRDPFSADYITATAALQQNEVFGKDN